MGNEHGRKKRGTNTRESGGVMSWQKCPKCSGTGRELMKISVCFICNGCGVINEQTGLPLYITVTTTQATDPEQQPQPERDAE